MGLVLSVPRAESSGSGFASSPSLFLEEDDVRKHEKPELACAEGLSTYLRATDPLVAILQSLGYLHCQPCSSSGRVAIV